MNANYPPELASIQQEIRRSIPKQEIERWLSPQVGRVYRDLALSWLGIGGAIALTAWVNATDSLPVFQSLGVGAIAFLVIGFCQYALFILGHDALHGSLHPDRVMNDRIAKWLVYGPMFMGLDDGRRNHMEHHRNLGTTQDPDRYLHSLENKATPMQFLLFCTGLATFGKTVLKVTPFGKLLAQSNPATPTAKKTTAKPTATREILRVYLAQRLAVMVTQPLLIGLFLVAGLPWWSYLVLWIAPIYFCVFLPDEIRAFCDHAVLLSPDHQADPYRLVTFTPGWFEARVFSPNNMNYHAEHHLFPTVPYYRLPQVHQRIAGLPEVTVKRSYFKFLWKVFRTLPYAPSNPST